MSAIVGIYFLDGRPVERTDLERMVAGVAHRGPDGVGMWSRGPVGLGHRMLWTTPESRKESLPLVNETGNLILTADARIDNREELMDALDISPESQVSDSQLIMAAYKKWGERCREKLLGDFAFALWDGRRHVLFCARDHLGVKPFYYYRSDRAFVFASEIKALLCLPEVPRRLNEVRVADYLLPIFEDKVVTFYQDILRLPPAHTMTVGREGASVEPYWSLDPSREVQLGSDREYAEAFRDIFTKAVRCRLRSAYPLGSMLSGGLDSSSIVCVARQLLSKDRDGRLHTFSAIFDDVPECDERPFINAVLSQDGLEPHYVHADRVSPLVDLDRVLWHQDEAFYAPNLFLHWGLYKAAQEHGVRVLLDGFDGDISVSHGIQRLAELFRKGRWIALAEEVRDLSKHFKRSPWKILLFHAMRPWIPDVARQGWQKLRGRKQPGSNRHGTISPGFARRVGLADRVQALQGDWSRSLRTARKHHCRGLTQGLIPFTLEVADRAAAAFSIEPRYPFFDKRLAEFCVALPPEQKLHRGWTRMVLRRAMENTLPEEVRWRWDKSDLSPNFVRGLLAFHRQYLDEVIMNDPKIIQEYVDVNALRESYHRYASRQTEDDALTVWKAVTLALWLRRTGLSL